MKLVSLDEAKDQVSILRSNTFFDNLLESKIEIASDYMMDFCKLSAVPDGWLDEASPANIAAPSTIKGCTLMMVAEMFHNRESSVSDPLSEAIRRILRMKYRDPSLA